MWEFEEFNDFEAFRFLGYISSEVGVPLHELKQHRGLPVMDRNRDRERRHCRQLTAKDVVWIIRVCEQKGWVDFKVLLRGGMVERLDGRNVKTADRQFRFCRMLMVPVFGKGC